MGWEAVLVMAVVGLMLVGLALELASADLIVIAALAAVVVTGELTGTTRLLDVKTAATQFGDSGLITVGLLFVVVTGLVQTGAMSLITTPLLGRPRTLRSAQTRLLLPVTTLSAFLNNTPVVAMFMPVIDDICKRTRISPSKLFLPMAYAATFGGVCTMIGTSTNLVVNGKLPAYGLKEFALFDLTWVGLPCAIGGVIFLMLCSNRLLPDRRPAISLSDDPRQYTVEMLVQPGGPLVGQTVEQAGLRHLPGLYLVEIERAGEVVPAVSPRERLQANDRLVFVGVVESVVDLRKTRGLLPATNQVFKLNAPETQRSMIEAVVSNRCPLVGKNIREGRFRTRYNAAVLAVARGGARIPGKIGDIVLQPGDVLLLEAHTDFAREQRNSPDFFLVSHVENSAPVRHNQAWIALATLLVMILAASLPIIPEYSVWKTRSGQWVSVELVKDRHHAVTGEPLQQAPLRTKDLTFVEGEPQVTAALGTVAQSDRRGLNMLTAALIAAIFMICTGCCTISEARSSIDLSVLIVIGAALGLGAAMDVSGAAAQIAEFLTGMAGSNAWVQLAVIYFVSLVLTELVTNNAAAALMVPIAIKTASAATWNGAAGVSPLPFLIIVMIAASCGFATPFGYQTNLMVYGPGGYKFSDYLRIGIPLDLLMMVIAVLVAPFVFPF